MKQNIKHTKSSRKWLKLNGLLLGVMVLSWLLVACNSSGSTQTNTSVRQSAPETPTTEPSVAATTVPANPTSAPAPSPAAPTSPTAVAVIDTNLKGNLVIWEAAPQSQAQLIKDEVAAFGKAYPNAKVSSVHYNPDELLYAVEDAANGGKLPDLILASSDYVANFSSLKALQPADKVFDQSFLAAFNPNALAGSNFNNSQWGVPFTYSGVPVMLYNKKLVPTAPATWSELGKVVRPLYDTKTKSIGLGVELNEPYILTGILGAYGGNLLDSSNQPTLDTPQMVSSLKFIQDLIKDKTARDESRLKNNQLDYAFRDGRMAVYITGDWDVDRYVSAINADAEAKLDLGIAPLPKVDETGKYPIPFNNGKTFFIGAQSKGDSLKVAQAYLQWLVMPQQQADIFAKAKLLPATKAFLASSAVLSNDAWSGLLQQLELSKPQPASLQARAVLGAIRPNLESVVANVAKPDVAAKQMQQTAVEKVLKLTSP